jgi:hypothetical protein
MSPFPRRSLLRVIARVYLQKLYNLTELKIVDP